MLSQVKITELGTVHLPIDVNECFSEINLVLVYLERELAYEEA